MYRIILMSFSVIFFLNGSLNAQKSKSAPKKQSSEPVQLSTAEKMGYARVSKYWGPGTFYCYAPGTPTNKMANNSESHLRDLTGLWAEDLYKEIAKQGFIEVPKNEVKKWFNENNSKDKKFFYAPDKSYILQPCIQNLGRSPAMPNGFGAPVNSSIIRYQLISKDDTLKVLNAIWQYLRDLNEMKLILSSFGSTFKKADPKAYPIQQCGSSGWTSMRAGTFVLKMVDGKPKGFWERNEDIVRRTIAKPEFQLKVLGMELGYGYSLRVSLQKEGYVLTYSVVAIFFGDLEPGNTWIKEYPYKLEEYKSGLKMDKEAVDVYKKAPLPPVLEDLNKLLHLK